MGKRRPLMAFAMMVFMLSLAGIPPLLGFFSKFYLFRLAIMQGHVTLTVIALLTSAVAAYFYLNVVAQMYFKEPGEVETAPVGFSTGVIVTACAAILLAGTAFAPWIMDWVGKIVWG
jgi:NADH-quinone oxidoreductase subunit N